MWTSINNMKVEGVIEAAIENAGSKSESRRFHIIGANGEKIRLLRMGDNPFTNLSLSGYEGQEVEVIGDMDGNTLLVERIERKS